MMMNDLAGFNAHEVEPQKDFEPLPAGWYPVMIVASEWRPTKAGDGKYLQLTLQVIEGEYEGRFVWPNLNLDNPNAQTVEIAQRTLSGICRAVSVFTPNSSLELHDRPFEAKLSVKPPKDGFEARNELKAARPVSSAGAMTQAPAAPGPRAVQGAAAPAAKASPPWKKSA